MIITKCKLTAPALWLIAILVSCNVTAQTLTVTSSTNATSLAQNLSGQGVAFANAVLNCPTGASGTFTSTNTNLGINSGIMLTSGQVSTAPGPNNSGSAGTDNNAAGDSALTALAGNGTFDACILEFDLTVDSDSLVFNYVFGSEEYDEFVCANVNDVFAFRISGPGIVGTPNIALIPMTTTPVSINTVNNGSVGSSGTTGGCPTGGLTNSAYYAGNTGNSIQYDGMTVVLQATIGGLTPCATYHMWLGVSDAGDGIYDSGVFLEEGSFVSVGVTLSKETDIGFGFQNAVEGCVNGNIFFTIDDTLPDPYVIYYQIGGDAINGVDYSFITDSIVIAPGDTINSIQIIPLLDSVPEGFETVKILLANICTGIAYDSIELVIQDSVISLVTTPDDTICRGEQVQVEASGGIFYDWTPGEFANDSTIANPILQPDSTTDFTVVVSLGNCFSVETLTIVVIDAGFVIDAGPDDTICLNESLQFNATTTSGQGPYVTVWRPSDGLTDSTILNPVASPLITTNYELHVTGQNGCELVDDLDLYVIGAGPAVQIEMSRDSVCPCDTVQLNVLTSPNSCGANTTGCNGTDVTYSVGAGATTFPSSPTQYPSIYGNQQNSATHRILYRATDLIAAGMAGGIIKAMGFNVTAVTQTTYNNFEIKMGCTSGTDVLTASGTTIMTTVFNSKNITIGTGWTSHPFDTDYDWDGVSNIFVEICFSNTTGGNLNTFLDGDVMTYDAMSYVSGATNQCGIYPPSLSTTRPQTQFDLCQNQLTGVVIDWSPGNIMNDSTIANPIATVCNNESIIIEAYDQGCLGSDISSVFVDTSKVEVTDDTTICSTATIQLNASLNASPPPGGWTYSWSPIGSLNNPNIANPIASPGATETYTVTVSGGACDLVDSMTITVGGLTLTVSDTAVSCYGLNDGSVVVSPLGGQQPYTFSWSNSVNNALNSNLGGGWYFVTVTDNQGCVGIDSAEVTQPDSIDVQVTIANISCFGFGDGSISLAVSGGISGYTFAWSNGMNTSSVSNLSPGSYSVTVSDQNSCQVIRGISITQPNALTITSGTTNLTAPGANDGSAWAIVNGGTLPYIYTWQPGGFNTDSITNLAPGTYTVTVSDSNGCQVFDTVQIFELILSFDTILNRCNGDADASVSVDVFGGIKPYTYLWNTNSTTDSIFNLTAGTYSVTVTDSLGITATGSVNVVDPSLLTATSIRSIISCYGIQDGSIIALPSGGTPPYFYSWSNSGNNQTVSSLGAGSYSVTVTDDNGCSTSLSGILLTEPDSLEVQIISFTNVTCNAGSDGMATTVSVGGRTPYSYLWTGGYNTANLVNVPSNNYLLTITDSSGCTDTASVVITQPTAINLSMSSTLVDCNGNSTGSASVSANGGTPGYTYAWSPVTSASNTVSNVPAGLYTVTVTDNLGCTVSASTSVNEPNPIQIDEVISNVLCFGGNSGSISVTVSQGTGPYTYQWSNGVITPNNSGISNGTYTLTVTDANGCTAMESFLITQPDKLELQMTGEDTKCAGSATGSIELSINGGVTPYLFNWSNGQTGIIATALVAGDYSVTVTDANGCTISGTETIEDPYEIVLTTSTVDNPCFGYTDGSIRALAYGNGNKLEYSIDGNNWFTDPQTNAWIFTDLPAGNYTVTVRDEFGCMATDYTSILEPAQIQLFVTPDDTLIDLGEVIQVATSIAPYDVTDILSYSWSPDIGLSCTDCKDPIISSYVNKQVYTLTVKYLNNCEASFQIIIHLNNDLPLFIPNAFTPNNDGKNDVFTVYGEGIKEIDLKVLNRWGEVVFVSSSIYAGWNGFYKGEIAENGVYVYTAKVVYLNGRVEHEKGSVTLIR